jgi:DNA-binding transcriptional LysR family regulator
LVLSERIVDLVDEGFDVAVRVEPLPDSSLVSRQLASYRLVICGAPAYFKKRGVPRTPDDLADHNCLTFTGSADMRAWPFVSPKAEALGVPVHGNLRSNSAAALLLGALRGQGLIYMPSYLVGDALQSGRLRTVLDDYAATCLKVRAIYPHSRHLSAKVRTFVDFLAERFQREARWDRLPKTIRRTAAAEADRNYRGKRGGHTTSSAPINRR